VRPGSRRNGQSGKQMPDNPQYTASEGGNDRKYFIMTPQIVWAECDSPYEFMLWSVVKMIAAEDGECYVGTRNLAKLCTMGIGTVSRARKALLDKGLLMGKLVEHGDNKVWHLSIPDLWSENVQWRKEHQSLTERISLKSAAQDRPCSPLEHPCSPLERKKNTSEEEPKDISVNSENQAFASELEEKSRHLNAQPQKHISAEERMAATRRASARGWANRSKQPTTHRSFEKALARAGDDAPALRSLQEQLHREFGIEPDWSDVSQVKTWVRRLKNLNVASHGSADIVTQAGKKLRKGNMTISSPKSFVNTARAIAAERATARTAPSARAVKEYR